MAQRFELNALETTQLPHSHRILAQIGAGERVRDFAIEETADA